MGFRKVASDHIKKYRSEVLKDSSASTFDRKMFSLKKFFEWTVKEGYLDENPVESFLREEQETVKTKLGKIERQQKLNHPPSYGSAQSRIIAKLAGKPRLQKLAYNLFYARPKWYKSYHTLPIASYFNYAILVLLMSSLGFGVYNQFFKDTSGSLAYPTSLTRAGRYLSFQGRLTNNLSNPVTTATNLVFKLYSVDTGGVALWNSGTCSITPDTDGIFSTLLGSSCGTEIASSVFSENSAIWLGVTVGVDAEATPRVQIATVAYAINSETLQGYPASSSATANTVPVMNNLGQIVLAAASPKMQSTSGTFAIEGQALTITTPDTSNGSIAINPDGTGTLNLIFEGAAPGGGAGGFVNATNANITSGALYFGQVASNATGYNLLQLKSGATPTDKFVVDSGGNITAAGTINGLTVGSGTISSGTWNGTAISTTYGGTGQNWSGVAQGSIPYFDGTGTMTTLGPGTSGYVLTTQGASANPIWTNAGSVGTNYWNLGTGTIYPGNTTLDLLLGASATTSAKFAFTGVAGGTPTASISGTTAGVATYLTGDGNLATTNSAPLTLGNSGTSGPVQFFSSSNKIDSSGNLTIAGTTTLAGQTYTWPGSQTASGFLQTNGTGTLSWTTSLPSTTTIAFDKITSGTNTTAAMVVGTGASLTYSGGTATSGVVNANQLLGGTWAIPGTIGSTTPNTGAFTTLSATTLSTSSYATISGSLALGSSTAAAGPGNLSMSGNFLANGTINGLNITSGTITNAIWNGTVIGTQYGGTGANNSTAAQYSIPYYSATGVLGGILTPGTAGYVLSTNSTGGAPAWIEMSATGTNYWALGSGTIYPGNTTLDLLLGASATTSAKFAFKNVLTGTPTASISGSTANVALFMDGNGNISTTNRQNLVLGNSTIYDTTGNILLNSNGTGNVGIGTTSPTALLDVAGTASVSGSLTFRAGASSIQTTTFSHFTLGGSTTGNITLNPSNAIAGGYVAPNTTNVSDLGTASLLWRNIYGTTLYQGANQVCDTSGNCSAATDIWSITNGALYPKNTSVDLLLGSTATTSAKFALKNVLSGVPTASISGTTTNVATFIDGDGNISTTNRANLVLGNSTTYNSTGNILLNPNGTGRVGVGTTTPNSALEMYSAAGGINDYIGLKRGGTDWRIWVSDGTTGTASLRIGGNAAGSYAWQFDWTGTAANLFKSPNDDINQIPLAARAASSQVANIFEAQNSGGTALFSVGSTGNITAAGVINAGGLSGVAYNALAGSGDTPAATTAITASNDLFVGGDAEIKGGLYLTGKNIFNVVSGVATSTISFAQNPATIDNYNALSYGSWLVNNSTNNGIAALMVNQSKGGDIFTASVSGVPKMTLTNAGNLGIGTTGPLSKLDVRGTSYIKIGDATAGLSGTPEGLHMDYQGSDPDIGPAIRWTDGTLTNTIGLFINSGVNFQGNATNPDFILRTPTTDGTLGTAVINLGAASTTDTTYFNAGNVGIGLTGPIHKLDVTQSATTNGYAAINGLNNGVNVGTAYGVIGQSTGASVTNVGGYFSASGATNNYGLIVNAGNVGIGTTTPGAPLDIPSTANPAVSIGSATVGYLSIGSSGMYDDGSYFSPSGTRGFYIRSTTPVTYIYSATIYLGSTSGTNVLLRGNNISGTNFSIPASGDTYFNNGSDVGIGTITPTAKLDIAGTASASANFSFRGQATAHTFNILNAGTLNIQRSPGGDAGLTSSMFIEASGDIGIGTTSPDTKLEINGYADSTNALTLDVATAKYFVEFDRNGTKVADIYKNTSGPLVFESFAAGSTTADFSFSGGSLNVTGGNISASGDLYGNQLSVGSMGTPTANFTIVNTGGDMVIGTAGAANNNIYYSGGTSGGHYFREGTPAGYTDLMLIANNGNASFGTTSALSITSQLDVYFAGGGTEYGLEFRPAADTTTAIYFENAAGTGIGSVSINATNTAYNTSSDQRLKENIINTKLGISTLMDIPVRDFNFINDPGNTTQGFIAQELYQVYPYAVTIGGNDATTNPWSVDYGRLTPLLVQSIQDLNNKIDSKLSIDDSGNLNITQESNGNYQVTDTSSGTVITNIGAFAQAVIANIKAGVIVTEELATDSFIAFQGTVDNMLVRSGLVSPVVQTALISPLPGDTDVTVQIGSEATSSGQFAIQNTDGVNVATIDDRGNATFSGIVESRQLVVDSEATVSGTLYADNIKSKSLDEIQALLTQVQVDQNLLSQSAGWNVNTATDSASLIAVANIADLYVTNQAAINSLSVTNALTIGTDMVIQSAIGSDQLAMNSIDSLTAPLRIQSLGMAPVEIMAGLIRIDTEGNVQVSGNLTVAGRIKSSGLTLQEENLQDTVFNVQDALGSAVATIDASGSASFGSISTPQLVIAGADATESGAIVDGVITTNSTIGQATIPAGVSEITIKNPKVTDYTLVYVTPTSTTENYVLYVKSKKMGEFVVGFTNPISIDVNFNWWIVRVTQ